MKALAASSRSGLAVVRHGWVVVDICWVLGAGGECHDCGDRGRHYLRSCARHPHTGPLHIPQRSAGVGCCVTDSFYVCQSSKHRQSSCAVYRTAALPVLAGLADIEGVSHSWCTMCNAFTLKYIKSIRYCSKYCKHRCKNWRTLPTFLHFQQNVPLSLLGMIQGIGYPDKLGANGGWLSKPEPRSHDSANNGAAALLVTRTGDNLHFNI